MKRKPVKDGLGNNVRDYYYDPSSQQIELATNPPEHISSSEKVGSPAHKQKFPDRYKSGYVDWWNRDKKEKIIQVIAFFRGSNEIMTTILTLFLK